MQTDRTTKILLFFIAAGLWGHLLIPMFAPTPSIAQGLITPVRIVGSEVTVPVQVRQSAPIDVRMMAATPVPPPK